jgi:hypothetical protein
VQPAVHLKEEPLQPVVSIFRVPEYPREGLSDAERHAAMPQEHGWAIQQDSSVVGVKQASEIVLVSHHSKRVVGYPEQTEILRLYEEEVNPIEPYQLVSLLFA